MNANSNIAQVASLVSDASRAAILTVLLDGRYHPASELAYMANIKPQTASFHLSKMVAANLVTVEQQGRHRYYGIQNQEVAQIMETLLSITPPVEIRSLNQVAENEALRQARTCYDHLAGKLGIQLTNSLLSAGSYPKWKIIIRLQKKERTFSRHFRSIWAVLSANAALSHNDAWIGVKDAITWPGHWDMPC